MNILKLITAMLTISVFAFGQIVGTSHDLSTGGPAAQRSNDQTRVCVFCHTPHNGSANELWNRTNPAATGDFTNLSDASLRCLSCHDGASAVNNLTDGNTADFTAAIADGSVIGTGAVLVGGGNLGTDLGNDHPVGIDYPTYGSSTADFHDGDGLSFARTPGNKVECSSCHDPHDTTFGKFMIASNSGSALCLDCHDK